MEESIENKEKMADNTGQRTVLRSCLMTADIT
jgi:hypothetical protein